MNVSKKLTGMIAAATAICTLGSGSALAAEPAKPLEAKPAAITQIGSFLIRLCDQLGKITVRQDVQDASAQAYQITVTTDGDVSYAVANAADINADTIAPDQQAAVYSDYVVVTTKEENGKTWISKDGGQTWEEMDISFQTQNK